MTGLELAVAKACSGAVAKASGALGMLAYRRIQDARIRNRLEAPVSLERLESLLDASPAPLGNAVRTFLQSPELEQLAFGLATDFVLRGAGSQVAQRRQELATHVREMLRLVGQDPNVDVEEVASAIFEAVDGAVAKQVALLTSGSPEAAGPLREGLVKSAANIAAASVRSSDLLRSLESLNEIREFESSLRTQVASVHGTMRLPHAGTTRQVPYERLFVQPSVAVSIPDARPWSTTLQGLVGCTLRTVMLGNPGGGKSTSSLKLAFDIAATKSSVPAVTVPFLVVLRNYAEHIKTRNLALVDYLHELCRLPYAVEPPEGGIEYLLMSGRAFVIFDGLDELLDVSLRRDVVQAVEAFAHRYPMTSILVTSREVGYSEAPVDEQLFQLCTLQPFDEGQVEAYVRKWFSLDESIEEPRKSQLADAFLADSQFVDDLRVNTLMLSLMCGIYASENYIPRNRPEVYEKCALLLFERWDKQRGIHAPLSFDAHVQAAMRSLALWLYPKQEAQEGIPRNELIDYMKRYLLEKRFDNEQEAENAAVEFIDFCKGRAWVLTDVGAERYGFTHRTFLEYFAASQLERQNASAAGLVSTLLPRIVRAEWDMLAQLAVQLLGKHVEDGADDFLELLLDSIQAGDASGRDATNVASFAARALEFVVPRPPVLRRIVDCTFRLWVDQADDEPLGALMSATAENLPLVTRYLTESLADAMRTASSVRALVVALHPSLFHDTRKFSPLHRAHWENAGLANAAGVQEMVEQRRFTDAWVARWCLRSGRMTMKTYIEHFGIGGLFETAMPARARYVSLGYLVLDTYLSSDAADRIPLWLDRDALVALLEAVQTSPLPWAKRYDTFFLSHEMSDHRPDMVRLDPMVRSVVVALALPAVEYEVAHREPNQSETGLRESALHRLLGLEPDVSLATLQPLDSRVSDLLSAWLDGRVSTLREASGDPSNA